MRRPTRQELDQAIIDSAALLFARHGYEHTSVQQIADAVGYSKTGLLHRFPSKEALLRAVADQFVAELTTLVGTAQEHPAGPARDLALIRAMTDRALHRQGTTALMVSSLSTHATAEDLAWLQHVGDELFGAFGVEDPVADQDRCVRILGALGAIAVIALATTDQNQDDLRELIVATAFDALGHPRTGPS
ncbi:MAG TPA: helix-turn-helix domain-containing protein [Kineosporiaceae bacterium]|nr:helix-turn-helix domain-containing protein [Kineosporiaceae bacterium]